MRPGPLSASRVAAKPLRGRAIVGLCTIVAALALTALFGRHARIHGIDATQSVQQEPGPASEPASMPDNSLRGMTSAPTEHALAAPVAASAEQAHDTLPVHDVLKEYPPNSRPVTQARADAFKYNRRALQFLPAVGPDKSGPPAFYSVFTADKLNVFAGETITLTLRAARAPNAAAGAFPIAITKAGLTKSRLPGAATVADLDFHDDGRGGDGSGADGTYTAVVDPGKIAELADYHGSVRAFVDFSANGVAFGHQLFFEYYPAKGIAGRLTGNFREAIEDGSLVVSAEIDVLQAGSFAMDATLLSRDDKAFCHSRFKGRLALGIQEARFLFFGKAIRDGLPSGGASPFKVSEIYGQMVPDPQQLVELTKDGTFAAAAVPLFDGQYVTKRYDLRQFSEAPWNGHRGR